ncbi:hypothetical protein TNCV_1373201 [Trichonephila clavipes]|uniref:Uncharacterized protein n=1 Tax=Trichonephila clavipes TaxID=2585209 RepID=A0A8X6WGR8_TRICX|nr:hypothetical protein TNCV_1373201 [Trichonephila clavipes]
MQTMRARAYCAHPSIRDHLGLRCMSRCPDQVVSLKRDPQCLSPHKQACYSFIDPLQIAGFCKEKVKMEPKMRIAVRSSKRDLTDNRSFKM